MTSRQQWMERVRSWRESGEDAEAFARRNGWKPTVLKWWGTHLARTKGVNAQRQTEPSVRLVPVVHETAPSSTPAGNKSSNSGLVVELSDGVRVRVQRGFDAVLLRQLMQALEAP